MLASEYLTLINPQIFTLKILKSSKPMLSAKHVDVVLNYLYKTMYDFIQ